MSTRRWSNKKNICRCERRRPNDFDHAHDSSVRRVTCAFPFECSGCESIWLVVRLSGRSDRGVSDCSSSWQATFNCEPKFELMFMCARARPWAQNCNWKEKIKHRHGKALGDDRKRAIMGLSPYITHCRRHSSFEIANRFSSTALTLVLQHSLRFFSFDDHNWHVGREGARAWVGGEYSWNVQLALLMYARANWMAQ